MHLGGGPAPPPILIVCARSVNKHHFGSSIESNQTHSLCKYMMAYHGNKDFLDWSIKVSPMLSRKPCIQSSSHNHNRTCNCSCKSFQSSHDHTWFYDQDGCFCCTSLMVLWEFWPGSGQTSQICCLCLFLLLRRHQSKKCSWTTKQSCALNVKPIMSH